jgi:hypothetical protein
MGAYDNITILRDTSLLEGAKSVEKFGKFVAGSIVSSQKAREARAASTEKNRIRVQGAQGKIAGLQWKNATDNQGKWKGPKEGELWDKYVANVKFLLEGDGGQNIGSIKAATEIETNSKLTDEQRSQYRAIMNKANIYQTNAIQNNSYALSDMIDFDGVGQKGMLNTHYWAGDTDIEKDTNMLTAFGLKNLPMKGSSYIKDQKIGDNGESLLFVETTIEKDSVAWESLSDETKAKLEENLVKNIATGKMEGKLTFQKDFASLISTDGENITGGLIRQIGTTINVNQINEESKIVSGEKLDDAYKMGKQGRNQVFVTTPVGESGKSSTTAYELVSDEAVDLNLTLSTEIDSRAEVMLDNPLQNPNAMGDLQAQMQNTLKMGTNDWNLKVPGTGTKDVNGKVLIPLRIINNFNEFNDLKVPEKEAILVDELKEQYYEETFSQLAKKKFKNLPYNVQQFIKNNEGNNIDQDKYFYLKQGKSTTSTPEENDLYMSDVATNILTLPISQNRDIPGAIEPKQEWSATNVAIHEEYLTKQMGLEAASGQSAKSKVRTQLEGEAKAAEDRGEVFKTPEEIDREVNKVDLESLWIKNPKNRKWELQPSYNSFSNKSLRKTLEKYVFGRTSAEQTKFRNYYTNQDRADLPN